MLFHITHLHNWQTCPAHNSEKAKSTFGKMLSNADASGVKLHSAFIDPPAHTIFMIVEANDAKQLELFLDPVFELGSADIRPVSNALDVLDRRTK